MDGPKRDMSFPDDVQRPKRQRLCEATDPIKAVVNLPQFELTEVPYGEGGYAKVMRGRDASGEPVAIKCVVANACTLAAMTNEAAVLCELSTKRHFNIPEFKAWLPAGSTPVGPEHDTEGGMDYTS